jgi:SAM-dependent methyltransferase
MTELQRSVRGLFARFSQPPADMYLRVDRIDALVEALRSMQHSTEVSEQRIALCEQGLDALRTELSSLKASMETEFSSLKTMLQRFSIGSQGMIARELAEAIAYRGDHANGLYRAFVGTERPLCSPPQPVPFTSTLCHQYHFLLDQYRFWARAMKERPKFSRKQWEWFYIAQVLFERGLHASGKRGIGFGVGREPLPSLFASFGVQIVATDQSIEAAEKAGWARSAQHSIDVSALNESGICTEHMFTRLASFMAADMNDIPSSLDEQFDFCWSSCSLEHLGSLKHGFDFIENSLRVLNPGGVAVHTTEFNLSSDLDTVESPGLSIYRRCDIDEFLARIANRAFIVSPVDWTLGEGFAETVVDLPPFGRGEPHIRLKSGSYDVTSIGIVMQKPF